MKTSYHKISQIARKTRLTSKTKNLSVLASVKDPIRQITAEQFFIDLQQAQEKQEFALSLWHPSQARIDRIIGDIVKSNKATLELNNDGNAVIKLVPTQTTTPNKPCRNNKLNLLTAICNILKTEALQLGLGKEATILITKILKAQAEKRE